AAILPFYESISKNAYNKLGTRIIYSLPIRALARGVYDEFKSFGITPVIHHGEEPESNLFSERAIITTVDQYFTAFAGAPLSWGARQSHAVAGASLTSYTVFDEVHLLNPKNGLQLLFAILRLRDRWALPTTVMTATLPDSVINFLVFNCGLKKVEASNKDVGERDSWREVNLTLHNNEMNITDLSNFIKEKYNNCRKIITFINTVDRAIKLYKELDKDSLLRNRILLSHSRFAREDRKGIEDKIHQKFGKNSKFEGILVTTQVAEAGLNISAPLIVTELSPMDSIIQRAGRCARFREDSKNVKGEIVVVKPKSEGEREWFAPYFDYIYLRRDRKKNEAFIRNKERISLSELTWLVLLEKSQSSIILRWDTEKGLLNLTLHDPYYTFINGSETLYFEDLRNKEIGSIIEKHRDKLDEDKLGG
ncbi:MAG: CRISPR-associated helicase Cas3', partial [Candidatus Jordarchaeaceae archaeon]